MCCTSPSAIQGRELMVPNVPKDPSRGEHAIPFTKVVYIEKADFREVSSCEFNMRGFPYNSWM